MKNGNETNEKKFKVTDLITNKRYNAILNLVLGFGTIIILIIMIRLSGGSVPNNTDINDSNASYDNVSEVEGFNNIKGKNFNFKYTLKENGKQIVYEGKQREDKMLFNDVTNKKEYYVIGDVVSIKKGNDYIISNNPSKYFNFFDVELVEKIISKSNIEEDEYIISNEDFVSIINGVNDVNDSEDSDSKSTDKTKVDDESSGDIYIDIIKSNGVIVKIDFDFEEYVPLVYKNVKSATLTLEYSNFNLIDDFGNTNN